MFRRELILAGGALATLGIALVAGQGPAGAYTAAQATAGRTTYQTQCASCHLPDLRGSGDAAPLAGAEFMGGVGPQNDARAAVVHAAHDAADAAGRVEPGRIRQHRRVHPPVERRAGWRAGAHGARSTSPSTASPRVRRAAAPQAGGRRGAAPAAQRGRPGGGRGRGAAPPSASPSTARSRTSCRSPTRCCAIRIRPTG